MDVSDEIDTLRRRLDALERRLNAQQGDTAEAVPARLVVLRAKAAYPAGGPKVYAAREVRISGERTEGAVPTLTELTEAWLYVAHLGADTPPEGSYAVAEAAGDHWVDS